MTDPLDILDQAVREHAELGEHAGSSLRVAAQSAVRRRGVVRRRRQAAVGAVLAVGLWLVATWSSGAGGGGTEPGSPTSIAGTQPSPLERVLVRGAEPRPGWRVEAAPRDPAWRVSVGAEVAFDRLRDVRIGRDLELLDLLAEAGKEAGLIRVDGELLIPGVLELD
ncbi:MAG: hypothetical protein AAF196_19275 [Planctomycetota bacterium]